MRGDSIAAQVWQHGQMQAREPGWLATGDLATRNAEGELIFAGRKSDVIVTSAGLNIYPQDLEAVLRGQPGLREALVVAYDSATGPTPVAVLIADANEDDDVLKLAVDKGNRELAAFQQIRYWLRWPQPEFPRTSTGKVLRRTVQSWAQQALASVATRPATSPILCSIYCARWAQRSGSSQPAIVWQRTCTWTAWPWCSCSPLSKPASAWSWTMQRGDRSKPSATCAACCRRLALGWPPQPPRTRWGPRWRAIERGSKHLLSPARESGSSFRAGPGGRSSACCEPLSWKW